MSGREPYARAQALEAVLSPATTIFVGLLETMPVDGSGEVEISPPGYARTAVVNWSTTATAGVTTRCNVDSLALGPYGPAAVDVRGWALYGALTNGNLVASGSFVDTGFGQPGLLTIPAGDDIQFQPGDLCVTIADDCPLVIGSVAPDVCPLPVSAEYEDAAEEIVNVPLLGPPPNEGAGNGPLTGFITMDAAFDGADFTAEYFFGLGPAQGSLTPTPAGPGPHAGWTFVWTQPGVGQVVTVNVTKDSDPGCTFSIGFTLSV